MGSVSVAAQRCRHPSQPSSPSSSSSSSMSSVRFVNVVSRWSVPLITSKMFIRLFTVIVILTTHYHGVKAQECTGHSDCTVDSFCTEYGSCDDCVYCTAFRDEADDGLYAPYTIDRGPCPDRCQCTSHRQCSDIQDANVKGAFCSSQSLVHDYDYDGVNQTASRTVCRSCKFLSEFGIFKPNNESTTDDVDDGSLLSSFSTNIPCLCSTSADCPEGNHCVSDIEIFHQYALGGYDEWEWGLLYDNDTVVGTTSPRQGYCVSCDLGCIDNLILHNLVVEVNGTNATGTTRKLPTCYDVCPFQLQCNNTHDDCLNWYSPYIYDDDMLPLDSSGQPIRSTSWCSENHVCNLCSVRCASHSKGWDYVLGSSTVFESVDGACPPGCCGFGLFIDPLWTPDYEGIIAPCGATSETEILALYVTQYTSYDIDVEYFVSVGQSCLTTDLEYLESVPASSTSSASPSPTGNSTTITRKATSIDCSYYYFSDCSMYPIAFAVLSRSSNASSSYTFLVEPIVVYGSDYCSTEEGDSKSISSYIVYIVIGVVVVLVIGIALVLKRDGFYDEQNMNHTTPTPSSNNTTTMITPTYNSASSIRPSFCPASYPATSVPTTGTVATAVPVPSFSNLTAPPPLHQSKDKPRESTTSGSTTTAASSSNGSTPPSLMDDDNDDGDEEV
jgi:hypothetical protein